MKKLFLSIIAVQAFFLGHAQFTAVNVNNQTVVKRIANIAYDNNGNTIITGYFSGSISFGPYTLGASSQAAFVAKMLPDIETMFTNTVAMVTDIKTMFTDIAAMSVLFFS
jgi:hypothetical protein